VPFLDGVRERVAEVEQRAPALLALVGRNDLRLRQARTVDRGLERLGIEREQRLDLLLDPAQELDIAEQPVLDDLGEPRAQLAWRQASRASRCRRRPPPAGETPRSGSCRRCG
jgi:hypothetical protein